MPPVVPFIPQIIGGGTALLGSLKGNKKENRTAEQSSQSHRTGQTQGVLTGGQQEVEDAALAQLLNLIGGGPNVLQADRSTMLANNAKAYGRNVEALQQNYTSRGMGQSGAMNKAVENNRFALANANSQGMAGLEHDAMDRWLNAIGLSRGFLTPRTVNTTEDFASTGTGTSPSDIGNIIGGSGFALAQFLKNILNRNGGGFFNAAGTGGSSGPGYGGGGIDWGGLQG